MENKYKNSFNIRLILILTSLSIGVISFFLPIYSKSLNMNAVGVVVLIYIILVGGLDYIFTNLFKLIFKL